MKFFTKQLYEKLEVKEFLWYFTSFISVKKYDETIKQIKESYIKEGKDYEAEQKESYEESYNKMKPLLLKYLPKDLRGVVYDDFSIYGKIPKQNLMAKIEKYRKSLYDLESNMSKKYSIYYKGIEKLLPHDIRNLNKEYSFHDSTILSFEQTSKDEIIIKLDCEGSYLPSNELAILTFNNVKFAELSDNYVGNCWYCNETHLSDIGNFDFQVMLHSYDANGEHSLNEFRIVADKVSLSF